MTYDKEKAEEWGRDDPKEKWFEVKWVEYHRADVQAVDRSRAEEIALTETDRGETLISTTTKSVEEYDGEDAV